MVLPALLLALSAAQAEETVRLRVFSRHAPREAVVEGDGRRLRLSEGSGTLGFVSTFTVTLPGLAPRSLRGALEYAARGGRLVLTAVIPLEQYVAGVAEAEAGASAHPELLKAQAVAARSWVKATPPRHEGAFCDLTHCQVFAGLAGPAGRAAAAATRGEVLTKEGRPYPGHYHAACGGELDAPEAVWGRERVPSRADSGADGRTLCALSPHLRWRALVPAARLESALRERGWLGAREELADLAVADRSPARRALVVAVNGRPVPAEAFLSAAGRALGWNVLKSAAFEVERRAAGFAFSGSGLGHGVGMCQAGAAELARRGASYREILAHYYPSALPHLRCLGGTCLEGGDSALLSLLERERAALPEEAGPVRVVAHPDFSSFRAAGGSARHAGRWREGVLHLAPPARLAELGALDAVVRHEMTHLWVHQASRGRAPRWLAEGVCVWRAGELTREDPALDLPALADGRLRLSYRQAGERVARLAERGGLRAVSELLASY